MDELRYICCLPDSPSAIALCETWLDSSIQDCEVSLPNYRLFRRDRDRHGGGIALFIHNSAPVGKVTYCKEYELLSAEVKGKSGLVLVAVVYRSPDTDCDLSSLEVALGSCHLSKYRNIMIVGDFNVGMNDPQSPLTRNFLSVINGLGLHQLMDEPTRVTNHSSSTIDLVLTTSTRH